MTPLPAAARRDAAPALPPAPSLPQRGRGLTPGLLLKAGVGVLVALMVALPIAFGMALAMAASVTCEAVRGVAVRPRRSGPTGG